MYSIERLKSLENTDKIRIFKAFQFGGDEEI
jgi:hypothetical protein